MPGQRPPNMEQQKQQLTYVGDIPVICGTCVACAQLGDGETICLKRSSVKNPFLFAIHPYNNAAQCQLWEQIPRELLSAGGLTDEELSKLSGLSS